MTLAGNSMAPMTHGPIAKLVAAYPDFLASHDANGLIWKDGTVMIHDDGKGEKDPETRLNEPDLKDMFHAPYPRPQRHSARS